ncbi:MAG: GDYXXLXY domain-containing protein [Betaproteobacteria bacterium]|nr:GDYXXLXY domain-containing protein [Betaproteobacteria bacterium]MDH5221329.1 GDYXXLXY domain-containing protein [Betaproteobacteria bacterium]
MSRRWLIFAIAAQLLVLAWMGAEREWIFRTGHVAHLRTAPIDPRDLFRGDFVRLRYDVNSVRREHLDAAMAPPGRERKRHEVVYTRLQPAGEGVYEAAGTSLARPAEGLFLRGRTEDSWRMGWRGGGHFLVKYGIEQLFVEQGAGLAIEKRRGTRDALQVPMEVEVAIARSGTAVIRGYRWSRLGMKLEVLRRPAPRNRNAPSPGPEQPRSPKLRVTLANASDAQLSVADAGEHCAFQLVTVDWAAQAYAPASQACAGEQPAARSIALAPGETYSAELDLSEPRWHVLAGGKPVEIGALPGLIQFRIEYRTPAAAPVQSSLWRGRMASQAFNASGVID